MAGKGGGAWKVAYADFVTAMMAFFMVMWLTSQSEPIREAVAEHFRNPPGVFESGAGHVLHGRDRGAGPHAPRAPRFHSSALSADDNPQAATPQVLKVHDGDDQRAGTIVLFAESSAELDESARQQLRQTAAVLAGKPQKIEIRGHASRRPLPPSSPYADPWQLSYARCFAAMQYLEQAGLPRERMRLSQAGPSEPYSLAPDPALQARDSRVEIFLLSELAEASVGSRQERAQRYHGPAE